ncbi:hypothetical protein Hgul01_04337 [Herpetosiphon gulosus]|uniref:Transposase n=1 Tax=Herpetosiphon gulosus TaxID=1973496 RepID=A0ABP9X6M4_9CHLR
MRCLFIQGSLVTSYANLVPKVCPSAGCPSNSFRRHQKIQKTVYDVRNPTGQIAATLTLYRYKCTLCGSTFRTTPLTMVRGATLSRGLYHLSGVLFLLGLSYTQVTKFLSCYTVNISRATVHMAVQRLTHNQAYSRARVFTKVRRENNQCLLMFAPAAIWVPLEFIQEHHQWAFRINLATIPAEYFPLLESSLNSLETINSAVKLRLIR